MFYEIIYETGNHSIANYSSDEEANRAIGEHHRRAKSGEPANSTNPQMGPAERVVKVLKYDTHPGDYTASQAVDVSELMDAVQKAVEEKKVGDMVSIPEVAAAVRDLSDPGVDSAPHESNYKQQDKGELTGWENNA